MSIKNYFIKNKESLFNSMSMTSIIFIYIGIILYLSESSYFSLFFIIPLFAIFGFFVINLATKGRETS